MCSPEESSVHVFTQNFYNQKQNVFVDPSCRKSTVTQFLRWVELNKQTKRRSTHPSDLSKKTRKKFGSVMFSSESLSHHQEQQHILDVRRRKLISSELLDLLQYDETGHSFLINRRRSAINVHGIKPLEELNGLYGGEIIEIYGPSQTGKTEICTSLIINSILPSRFKNLIFKEQMNGCISYNPVTEQTDDQMSVIFFDNDGRFSLFRFIQLLEHRVHHAVFQQLPHAEQEKIISNQMDLTMDAIYVHFGGEEGYKQFITNCMKYLIVFKCDNAFRFWVTIEALIAGDSSDTKKLFSQKDTCGTWLNSSTEKTSHVSEISNDVSSEKSRQKNYKLIVIDSANTWMVQSKDMWESAFSRLPILARKYDVAILCTKSPTRKRQQQHKEFMPSKWVCCVNHRITLSKLKVPVSTIGLKRCSREDEEADNFSEVKNAAKNIIQASLSRISRSSSMFSTKVYKMEITDSGLNFEV